jgi:hypothetical protein
MSRIRTVKPELFKHEDLFDAEIANNLPLRLAFIGLLTCCDREGRFKWRPRRLKLDILPYDDVDIVKVLDALQNHGFIKKYEHQGEWYGCVPSFCLHQQINHREMASNIVSPEQAIPLIDKTELNTTINNPSIDELICETPVPLASTTCQPMIESSIPSNHNNENINVLAIATKYQPITAQEIFMHWKKVMHHPDAKLDSKRQILINKALDLGYSGTQLCNAITGCSMTPHNMGNNNQGQRYDGLHIILRDADQIDRFIHHCNSPPQPVRDVDKRTQGNMYAVQRWIKKMQSEVNNAQP